MSKLEKLIQQYCPDGVEWKPLGELGDFYSGLSGKTKSDFTGGNEKFITYVNVFNNPSLKTDVPEKVKIAEGERQNTIQYGDILFTGSSETPDECGMSSVLTHKTEEKLYLNSFCFGFRFYNLSDKCPSFMKYLFRSTNIRKAICKTANGVTRYNISKKEFAKIEIPMIPLPVQEEIVRVLDAFTELQAELQAELQKRKQQYNFYRDNLLNFKNINRGGQEIKWMRLKDVATQWYRGAGIKREEVSNEGMPCIRYGEIHTSYNIWFKDCISHTDETKQATKKYAEYGDILFAITSEDIPLVGNSVAYLGKEKIMVGGDIVVMKHHQDPRYMAYALSTSDAIKQKGKGKVKSKVVHTNVPSLQEIVIPIPPMEEQQRIADILDRFDTLTNDLTSGLPAEIEKRRQQYEFYRDKLLTFKRKEA